jgi:hypothetical protein
LLNDGKVRTENRGEKKGFKESKIGSWCFGEANERHSGLKTRKLVDFV